MVLIGENLQKLKIAVLPPLKVCLDAKEGEWGAERYRTYSSLVNLQLSFLSLRWKTCPWAEHSDDDDDDDDVDI